MNSMRKTVNNDYVTVQNVIQTKRIVARPFILIPDTRNFTDVNVFITLQLFCYHKTCFLTHALSQNVFYILLRQKM